MNEFIDNIMILYPLCALLEYNIFIHVLYGDIEDLRLLCSVWGLDVLFVLCCFSCYIIPDKYTA